MNKITIDPITRLEGHGRIEILLNDEGMVDRAYFQVPELRGFEAFCIGRQAEEMPVITNRICGVCPEAHHIASVKALDALFGVEPPVAAKRIRELLYMAFFIADHATHFYILGGPDFFIGPEAPPCERNIFGVIRKLGQDIASRVVNVRRQNHHILSILGGREIHPTGGIPGGWSKRLSEKELGDIKSIAENNLEFSLYSLWLFQKEILNNQEYLRMFLSEIYTHKTYYMGLVDDRDRLNFYEGLIRIIDPEGKELVKYQPSEYASHISEHTEQWSYVKFPFLKNIGWKGFIEGSDSGIYTSGPLARLNVSRGISTRRAQEHYEQLYETFGCRKGDDGSYEPLHHRLATHWARLIEMLYASERMLELLSDPSILSPETRNVPTDITGEGIGCVEAPRGNLIHHYISDHRAVLKGVNMIVGTTNNAAAISLSITKAAKSLINKANATDEGILNRVEMAFRLYDPCLSCATHSMPGKMPLLINIRDRFGNIIKRLTR